MKRIAAGLLAAGLLVGFAAPVAFAQQTASERAALARYQRYAQAPVDRVHYFRIDGFEYLAPDKLAIWFGVNKLYLLTLQTPCLNLQFANAIGLTSQGGTLHSKFDFVTFGHQRCKVLKIVPVNELQMKRDANKEAGKAAPASGD